MKVLFVVTSFPSAQRPNIGVFNARAAKQISKFCSITIVHFRSWIPGRKLIGQYNYESFIVTDVALPYWERMPGPILALFTRLYKYLSYNLIKNLISGHDVIHSVGIALPGIVCSFWAKKQNKPHIAQTTGTDVNYRIGLIKKYPGIRGWEKTVSYLIGNSHSLVNEFRKHYPDFPKTKISVIYRGVNLQEFIYSEPFNIDTEIIFLYLGGISDKHAIIHGMNFKGILTLLKAWNLLLAESRTRKISTKLYIGGPNTKDNEYLREKIKGVPSGSSIEIIGSLSYDEVKRYMQKSAVIIVPSMAEGLPNVVMEAAASGRPVIASRVGGIPELVLHNQTGFLFEPGNAFELVSYLQQFIKSPELIRQFGKNARERMVNLFDSNQFPIKYLALYKSSKEMTFL